ncbi:FadR/GntR family transcriptional regulator [Nocardia higoensis]|uniref:FadR/GntR family transcriptional regulator n=1 Tax=Nocardia higoensis TaxID=228599 RepID=UPI0002EEFFE1|nr:GntR family transcriptional regulator [Nocardia higoensis]
MGNVKVREAEGQRTPGGAATSRKAVKERGPANANGGEVSLLRPLKAAESVARTIVGEIQSRRLAPGASLPSEAAMLEKYGVSRESLREGLRLLEVQGMITIRRGPGGGPIVGSVDAAHLGRVSALFYNMDGATYEELLESWVWAEGELAERAARYPDAKLRAARMEPFLHEHDDTPEGLGTYLERHAGFHGSVAGLASNRVLALSLQTYGQIVAHHVAVLADPRQLRDVLVDDHRHIAKAIALGRPRQARELMTAHLRGVVEYCRERLTVPLDSPIEWL